MDPQLWHTRPLLAFASLLPVPLGALWMILAPALPPFARRRALLTALTWLLTRVAFGALVWGALGHSGIDQLTFFLPQARHALAGQLVYRDFPSAYGPLFAPLLAVAVAALGNVGPFVLFLCADFIAWRALAAADGEASEAAWGYVALPLVWYLAVRYAQDEPLCAAFIALAYLAHKRAWPMLAGLALGVGLLVTKPLFALPALPFLLAGRGRARLVLAAAAPVVLVYGALLVMRAPVLQPFTLEGGNFGVGPTLWRVPVTLLHFDLPGATGWLPFAALLAAGVALLVRRGAPLEAHAAWQYGAFAALSPKFMIMYAIMWAPLIAVWAAKDPDRRGWWLLYGATLPLAWYLDSGPMQGLFGIGWQVVGVAGIIGVALLALWPLAEMRRAADPTGSPDAAA